MEDNRGGCKCTANDLSRPTSRQQKKSSLIYKPETNISYFSGVQLKATKQKERDKEAYRTFVRKISKSERDGFPFGSVQAKYRVEQMPFKIDSQVRPINVANRSIETQDGVYRFDGENINSYNPNDSPNEHYDMEFPSLTMEEKEHLFHTLMRPWIKDRPKSKKEALENQKKSFKPKLKARLAKKQTGKKKLISAKSSNKEISEFFATATAGDLQRYYRTVPSRTDSKPCDFPADTFLRPPKLYGDLERINEMRKENYRLVFNIVKIRRTTGAVDHINRTKYPDVSRIGVAHNRIKAIEAANLQLYHNLINARGRLPNLAELETDWKKNIVAMERCVKYPLTLPGLVDVEKVYDDDQHRPKVFLEIGIEDGNILGKLVLSLYLELMPTTVTNFVALCENSKKKIEGNLKPSDFPHLAGSPIHRIFPDLYFEGGDIVTGYGATGKAARGLDFYPESLSVPHNNEGTISMTVTADGRISSLFAISFRPLELLKGRRPAFGRVVKGFKLLKIIESYGTKNGKPKQKIIITRCGLMQPK